MKTFKPSEDIISYCKETVTNHKGKLNVSVDTINFSLVIPMSVPKTHEKVLMEG